jgi:hypothetical protein
MTFHLRSRLVVIPSAVLLVVGLLALAPGTSLFHPTQAYAASTHMHLDCSTGLATCTEVHDAEQVFGADHYVGHDEPSTLFYSNKPGSGNQMQYRLTLPKDPATRPTQADGNTSANFQLHPAFWFGMAMCDTQSYPEQVSTCTPDSDSNIVDPAISPNHAGTAFMEMQFYPPGWELWPQGNSCDATQWCAALNIDSLAEDPVNGTTLNATCAAQAGLEYVNFAFITKDGRSQAPANPVQSTLATFTPNHDRDLFMNSGDQISVTLHDTAHGLHIELKDLTTGQAGSMTASAENGFGQVKYVPDPSTECTNIPYDFHPMYSTSSEQTRVIWAAHSYNIAFADEIGHFDYCSSVPFDGGHCAGTEGAGSDQEPADGDDRGCFQMAPSGCQGTNAGFDGTPYQPVWPDGDTAHHPTPILFTSPLTGDGYNVNYDRFAFEADLPRIEGTCNRNTGAGCTLLPITDDGTPAPFYPFFTVGQSAERCVWAIGNDIPGFSQNDFGRNNQYGPLLLLTYLGLGGTTFQRFNDFRQVFPNRCLEPGSSGGN